MEDLLKQTERVIEVVKRILKELEEINDALRRKRS